MSFANSVILYNCKINHNGLFGCDFGGSGATRDSVMGATNNLATVKFSYTNCTYMRKDKTITVDENADVLDAAGVNYCRYINTDFSSNHYFYAFVEKIEYVAPQTSRLYIKTDVFMTYFHKIIPNQCFVEREHVADDRFLNNSTPESVPTGSLIRKNAIKLLGDTLSNDDSKYIAAFNIAVSDPDSIGLGSHLGPVRFGGVIQGTQWYGVELHDILRFAKWLEGDPDDNRAAANILSITICSKNACCLTDTDTITAGGVDITVYKLRDYYPAESGYEGDITIYAQGTAEQPAFSASGVARIKTEIEIQLGPWIETFKATYHNLKLLMYPFTAWELFTHTGGSTIIQPQDCTYGTNSAGAYWLNCTDSLVGGLVPSETAIVSISTGSTERKFQAEQSFSAFPTLTVTQDAYNAFMSRNSNSVKYQKDISVRDGLRQMNTGILNMFQGGMDANIGKALNGYYQTTSAADSYDAIEAKLKDQKMAPDAVVGQASDGALYQLNKLGVFFGISQVNNSFLGLADSFFDRYGYAKNKVKTPQWNSRPNFNYIKTNGANIGGEIPQSDKEEINRLLDTGMTIWHNVGSYGQFDGANNLAPTR